MIKDKDNKQKLYATKIDKSIKEKSIRTNFSNKKDYLSNYSQLRPYLFFDPPEVILQNIELKINYEIPIRIHNISTTSKRILIKGPFKNNSCFKLNSFKTQSSTNSKDKSSLNISPGLYYEFVVMFETNELDNYDDKITVMSENNTNITLNLKAYKPQPFITYEPFVNLGFIPINCKKIEKISFLNEGIEDANLELRLADKEEYNDEVRIINDKFRLPKLEKVNKNTMLDIYNTNNRNLESKNNLDANNNTIKSKSNNFYDVYIIFNPISSRTIETKIEIFNLVDNSIIGEIDVVGTSVEQQLAVVYEEGGGPVTEVNFGSIFYGQRKEIPAFIVNNGPYQVKFRMFFHVVKDQSEVNLDDSDFACGPEDAGKEMVERILGCNIKEGVINQYEQLPITFEAISKVPDKLLGWKSELQEDNSTNNLNINPKNQFDSNSNLYKTITAIKFEYNINYDKEELEILNNEFNELNDKYIDILKVNLEMNSVLPHITLNKTEINFWDCPIGESRAVIIKISNKNDNLPVDFNFNKIPFFKAIPCRSIIQPLESKDITITFSPINLGSYISNFKFYYINNLYCLKIKVLGKAISPVSNVTIGYFNKMLTAVDNSYNTNYLKTGFVNNYSSEKHLNTSLKDTINIKPFKTKSNFPKYFRGTLTTLGDFNNIKNTLDVNKTNKEIYDIYLNTYNNFKNDISYTNNKVLGPEATDLNFKKKYKYLTDDIAMNYTLPNMKKIYNVEEKTLKLENERLDELRFANTNTDLKLDLINKFKTYKEIQKHKLIYNSTLNDFRKARLEEQISSNDNTYKTKVYINDNISENKNKYESNADVSNLNTNTSSKPTKYIDKVSRIVSPKMSMPKSLEGLWVTRPIGKYEPYDKDEISSTKINFDPNKIPNKIPDQQSKYPTDNQDIQLNLDGYKLQRIFTGPSKINFGEVFKNSEETKTFWVQNTLRTAILIEFQEAPEFISNIFPKKMIVRPNSYEGAQITFKCSVNPNNEEKTCDIKYKINGQKNFKIKINAIVVYANFKVPKFPDRDILFKFGTSNSSSEMKVSEIVTFKNEGNADVEYEFMSTVQNSHFKIIPSHGVVKLKGTLDVTFIFDPSDSEKQEIVEVITCKITNGVPLNFTLKGISNPCKPIICDPINGILHFNKVSVGTAVTKTFKLLIEKTTFSAYEIRNSSKYLTFRDPRGSLDMKPKGIEVDLKVDTKIENFNEIIKIYVRGGGKPIELKITADIIIPDIIVFKPVTKFPVTCNGEEVSDEISFKNRSELCAVVEINMQDQRFNNFRLEYADNLSKEYYEEIITSYEKQEEDQVDKEDNDHSESSINSILNQENNLDNTNNETDLNHNLPNNSDNNVINKNSEENKVILPKKFEVKIKPNNQVKFKIVFTPSGGISEGESQKRILEKLRFKVKGLENQDNLYTELDAIEIKSRIDLKSKIFFKKMFINSSTELSLNNLEEELPIYNLDFTNSINFNIDKSCLNQSFKIEPTSGTIDVNDSFFIIKIKFCPSSIGNFDSYFYINLLNNKTNNYERAKKVFLYAEATNPRIYFDKREILFPVVPLGFESRVLLKIKNGGYSSMQLDKQVECLLPGVDIKVVFINGNVIGGIKGEELKLEVTYYSKIEKPVSFSGKLNIIDKSNQKFTILIHGVSDNSVLSNYLFYLQRKIVLNEDVQIMEDTLSLNNNNNNHNNTNNINNTLSLNIPINIVSIDDRKEIEKQKQNINNAYLLSTEENFEIKKKLNNEKILRLNKRDAIYSNKEYKNYLIKECDNLVYFVNLILDESITNFPNDFSLLKNKGIKLIELIQNISGLNLDIKDTDEKLDEKSYNSCLYLKNTFNYIINYLKKAGANLNTVLPEYLLDKNTFKIYIKRDEYTKSVLYPDTETLKKVISLHDKIYYYESWLTLIYQIIKIFYISRINLKSFKNSINKIYDKSIGMTLKNLNFKNCIPSSNFYSQSEMFLLKWLNVFIESMNNNSTSNNIVSFSENLRDGNVIYNCICSYIANASSEANKISNSRKLVSKFSQVDKLIELLKEYGVYTHFDSKSYEYGNEREFIVYVAMLFQALPYFEVIDVINFECDLNDIITKQIELKNSYNNKAKINYKIKKFGNSDFCIDSNQDIQISPGETYYFKVQYKARFKENVSGKIYFINKTPGLLTQARPFVYELTSNVIKRNSIGDPLKIKGPLYKKTEFKFYVRSPFNFKGDFTIKGIEIYKKQENNQKLHYTNNKKHNDSNKNIGSSKDIPVFFLANPNKFYKLDPDVKEGKEHSAKEVTIFYCPITREVYYCNLIFSGEQGEFQITLEGKNCDPDLTNIIHADAEVNESKDLSIDLKINNDQLLKALDIISNSENNKDQQLLIKNKLKSLEDHKTNFNVECTSNCFSFIKQFVLDSEKCDTKLPIDQRFFSFPVRFICKSVQRVEANFIFKNISDVRVYKVIVNVKPKNITGNITITCPINQCISQLIPFTNKNDKECLIKSDITQHPRHYFSIESEKKIHKHCSENIVLKFYPRDKSKITGNLTIRNISTGESYIYSLEGYGDDPLAEEEIFIECKIREFKKCFIDFDKKLTNTINLNNNEKAIVPNYFHNRDDEKETMYRVETDLNGVLFGNSEFHYKPKEKSTYEFSVKPLIAKDHFGKIAFYPIRENQGNYKWYTINIKTIYEEKPQEILLKTEIRKAIYIDMLINNPLNEKLIYDVEIAGAYLQGDSCIHVRQRESQNYRLTFSPLKVLSETGLLRISNEKIGERLYTLNLIAEEPSIIYHDTFCVELGTRDKKEIILKNPSTEEVTVVTSLSNPYQFELYPKTLIIPPESEVTFLIFYRPSQLEHAEDCNVQFITEKIGKWIHYFTGRGTIPDKMLTTYVNTFVGGSSSGIIDFKNPFNSAISIIVELKHNTSNAFKFVYPNKYNKKSIKLGKYSQEQISFAFYPKKLIKYSAEICVTSISPNLTWRYPIEGVTEVRSKGLDFNFKTKAKQKLDTYVELDLTAVPEEIDLNELAIETRTKEEKYKDLLDKCLTLSLEQMSYKSSNKSSNYVQLAVKFYPLRPFKTETEIILIKRSGGQWLYNMIIEATEPDPEDKIKIQSSIGKPASVSFRLHNIFTKNAKFLAYFTHDSSAEFSVAPKDGVLDQSMKEGTLFIITYLPREYGKYKIGKLVIETDEVQWIYHVHGTHYEYILPEIKSKINEETISSISKLQSIKELTTNNKNETINSIKNIKSSNNYNTNTTFLINRISTNDNHTALNNTREHNSKANDAIETKTKSKKVKINTNINSLHTYGKNTTFKDKVLNKLN